MNIKLLGDKVLIRVEAGEKKTNSGLILAKTEEMGDFMSGVVVAVGKGKTEHGYFLPTELKVGDQIMFQYGKPIIVEGEQYMLAIESDIIMVV